ncbi:MAG: hypothetical protein DRI56_07500 [Chloroflexota bacterium]|nr:MAG: hypothetical protein DRI56_07500 [Chloroflexota bacterium]
MTAEILIVDDEKNIRESLQDSLKLEGCGVGAVDGGENALDKLNEGEYDLMLLGLKIPGINGVEVMRQAHRLHPHGLLVHRPAPRSRDRIGDDALGCGVTSVPSSQNDLFFGCNRSLPLNKKALMCHSERTCLSEAKISERRVSLS